MNRLRFIGLFALAAGSLLGTRAAVADSPCFEDLDGNGEVGGGDISAMLLDFGPCPGCGSDLDGDGEVTGSDISLLLLSFGPCGGLSWATVLEWSPDPAVIYDANLRADIAATHWPWRVRDNGTGIEMVLIPPGSYLRGCNQSEFCLNSFYGPPHQVTLTRAFYLSRTEVTQARWVAKMGSNPSCFAGDTSRPVEQVNWSDASDFCMSTGLRLPSEAEWEYAYRAGTTTAFHGWAANPSGTNDASQLSTIAWFTGNSGGETHAVATLAANGFGLYDMAGNVWEWVQDWLSQYQPNHQTDPAGPATSVYTDPAKVLRGGNAIYDGAGTCTAFCRASNFSDRVLNFGFRVARTP